MAASGGDGHDARVSGARGETQRVGERPAEEVRRERDRWGRLPWGLILARRGKQEVAATTTSAVERVHGRKARKKKRKRKDIL